MNLVENDPGNFLEHLRPSVQHSPENFSRHHQTAGIRGQRDVTGHEADVRELLAELPILLVAESLERRSVDHSLFLAERESDGVLGNGGFPGRGVRRDEDRFVPLQAGDGDALKRIEHEGVGLGHGAVEEGIRQGAVDGFVLGGGVT